MSLELRTTTVGKARLVTGSINSKDKTKLHEPSPAPKSSRKQGYHVGPRSVQNRGPKAGLETSYLQHKAKAHQETPSSEHEQTKLHPWV